MRIDQWVPALHRGDAIGDSARLMRGAFRSWGHTADVYTLDLDDDLRDEGRLFSSWSPGGPDDVVILHFALPSPLSAALREHRGRRVLLHHNITPGEFFDPWDEEMARICRAGREELRSLAPHVDLGLGDSEFNRRQLEALGVQETGVLPIYVDFARYRETPGRVVSRMLDDERTNLLFVGRVAPNKKFEDLIRLASCWRRYLSPAVRLVLVGRLPRRATGHGVPLKAHYFDALQAFAYEEGLQPDEVLFTDHVQHDDLLAAYATADVFVSMSEHEGFGVPLVEAMLMDVPVLARRAAAVPDTLGDAGVLFDTREIAPVAEMAYRLATDRQLRAAVLAGQKRRLQRFAPAAVEADLRRFVESVARRP
jgi:L-malate glycosyltransferase